MKIGRTNASAGGSNVNTYDTETVSAPANGGTLTLKNATETVISTTLTNTNSFTIALPTAIAGKVNESILIFKTGATLPTLTQPSGVVYRTETPVIAINQTWTFCYERVSFNGGSTYEIYYLCFGNIEAIVYFIHIYLLSKFRND